MPLKEASSLNSFIQTIKQPTLIIPKITTLIDIILSNKHDLISNSTPIPSTLGDHETSVVNRKQRIQMKLQVKQYFAEIIQITIQMYSVMIWKVFVFSEKNQIPSKAVYSEKNPNKAWQLFKQRSTFS